MLAILPVTVCAAHNFCWPLRGPDEKLNIAVVANPALGRLGDTRGRVPRCSVVSRAPTALVLGRLLKEAVRRLLPGGRALFPVGRSLPGLLQPLSKHWGHLRPERSARMCSPPGPLRVAPPLVGGRGRPCDCDMLPGGWSCLSLAWPSCVYKHVSRASPSAAAPGVAHFCGSGSGCRCGNCSGSLSSRCSTLQPKYMDTVHPHHGARELTSMKVFSVADKHVSLSHPLLPEMLRRWLPRCARDTGQV